MTDIESSHAIPISAWIDVLVGTVVVKTSKNRGEPTTAHLEDGLNNYNRVDTVELYLDKPRASMRRLVLRSCANCRDSPKCITLPLPWILVILVCDLGELARKTL
uniref:Uncharacterized protein n=1 Tax=Cacopsylla melanoneura TaxID=428564 RepID=A0A8D8SR91_9HEMI